MSHESDTSDDAVKLSPTERLIALARELPNMTVKEADPNEPITIIVGPANQSERDDIEADTSG